MIRTFSRYARWLHTRWPAGVPERLPAVGPDGVTKLSRVRVVGDLAGVPLLKFASETAVRAVRAIAAEVRGQAESSGVHLVVIGAGVSGVSAAIEARAQGFRCTVIEATEAFSTLANFPKQKPIYTYPTGMTPSGGLQFHATVKEALLEEVWQQAKAAGVEISAGRAERLEQTGNGVTVHLAGGATVRGTYALVAIGRSGDFRKLGCPGEELPKVSNRLHDPKDFAGQRVLVVGGGDTACETAIALTICGAHVTLSYRGTSLDRPKPENVDRVNQLRDDPASDVAVRAPTSERVTTAADPGMRGAAPTGSLTLALGTTVREITPDAVRLTGPEDREISLPNDAVFVMIGREAPLAFFRRSGLPVRGEWTARTLLALSGYFLFCCFLYLWKGGTDVKHFFEAQHLFPFNVPGWLAGLGPAVAAAAADPKTPLGTLTISLTDPGFYYSLAYTVLVVVFGFRRITRRRTPYVTAQTLTFSAIQIVPLFLLPYFLLPWLGHNGAFDAGFGRVVADNLFPVANYGQGREYWRAFGLVLAWPLFIWNLFTEQPLWWWLAISFLQTGVIIPLIVRRWGKGAYCGWICSCGALAETLGDRHREKMPHGPVWNRVNLVGQAILGLALLILLLRVVSWALPGLGLQGIYYGLLSTWHLGPLQTNYYQAVDIFLAGVVGFGLYFWFSGRVWCRFACPLAALMHVYARFGKFRIFADKKKCISCNVCTSVCHQGIDVMNFANKGLPMEDPQCVRCSACVQGCPTGVLSFGRYAADGRVVLDRLEAKGVREGQMTK